MLDEGAFRENLRRVRERIASACADAGRPAGSVTLLPVTKVHPVTAVEFALRAGLPSVGENRVQEAAAKRAGFDGALRWELIGHLQSNKSKLAVEVFDRIQSVDSVKLLQRLDGHARDLAKSLPVLLEVNAGADPNKYGFSPDAVDAALEAALELNHIRVEGLMTIAPLDDDPAVARHAFDILRETRDRLAASFGVRLPELSMGMTGDLEAAIAAGSTCVRVGTALFGSR